MELETKCEQCGKVFVAKSKLRKYCSQKCIAKASYGKNKKPPEEKVCAVCGEKFEAVRKNKMYCSYYCVQLAHKIKTGKVVAPLSKRRKHINTCENCGKLFEAYSDNKAYCSEECVKEGMEKKKAARLVRKTKKPKVSAAEIARKAREEHLTYGQYVAKYGL